MQANELAEQTMSFASDLLKRQDELVSTDARLKVLYQITKLLEVCKVRESVVNQFHISTTEPASAGVFS